MLSKMLSLLATSAVAVATQICSQSPEDQAKLLSLVAEAMSAMKSD